VLFSEASEYEKSLEEVALKILLNFDLEMKLGKIQKSEQNLFYLFNFGINIIIHLPYKSVKI